MPYPFIRADENPQRTSGPTPGVRLTFATGVAHWYPGATSELAMVLVRLAVPEDLLNHPRTVIEFGTRRDGVFVLEQTVKGPPPDPNQKW